ncbi:XRE family transcriptional regulator [Clostridium sp. D2Q-14]|uniref:XRE family transcriptional regulator n=1 Tax=Anaeromonas gelatinilytica TaxID=2683194 RepID=UPI00193B97A9|nr:XRE family transcriptional regulator [Anaeromonas gelatinilytica]MBS4536378.1 XRE family transcriptional regulator [Anaeromonas gelatinilytica]
MKIDITEELLDRLNRIRNQSDLKNYIDSCSLEKCNYELSEYILKICENKGYGKSDIIRNSDMHRTYGYQILSGDKSPSRDKLLQICIGNKFTRDQANRALTIANLGILYAKDPRDSIIIYSLNNKLNLIDTNVILDEHGFKLIGYV